MKSVEDAMSMRLEEAQSELNRRGIKSVYFTWNPALVASLPFSTVCEQTARFVEEYLSGRGKPMQAIGDAPASNS